MCGPTFDRFTPENPEGSSSSKPACDRLAPVPVDQASRGRTLLESHFVLIQQKLQCLSRHSGLPAHEADEFLSWAFFKLVDNDYRILAGWEGRSSFSTYLTVVLVNLMRDYRIHIWGKWRPSAAARQQGPEAVLLERLLLRDALSLDEAIQIMQSLHRVAVSRSELEKIAERLPWRAERRQVGEAELRQIGIDGHVEERVEQKELARITARLHGILSPLLRKFPAESRVLLKLHYRDGLSMATISRLLGQPQKELYRFRDRCLKKLRRSLEEAGLRSSDVSPLLGSMGELSSEEERVWE